MRFIFSVFTAFLLLKVAECSRHYLLKGYLPETRTGVQLHYKEIRRIVESEISNALPNHSPFVLRIREGQHRSKLAAIQIDVELVLEAEISTAIFETKQAVFSSYIETDGFEKLDDLPEPDCFNEGYPGPNGTCICQDYYDGVRCQFIGCVNGGIPDLYSKAPQCFCPPGYNDFFCENRGCRPPVQDDINPPSKNLIVLMPATTVFKPLREKILDNFEAMVNKLQSQDPKWIGHFVGGNYYAEDKGFMDNKVVMHFIITSNLTEFIKRMRTMDGLKISKDYNYWDQGLIGAIEVAMYDSFNGRVSGYPMVLAYSNTVDNQDWSLYSLTYQANYWRPKIFMNVINNSSAPMLTNSTMFANYYQFSQNSHAPLLFYNIEDIDNVHTNVLPQLYKPQYVDVRSQADCSSGLVDALRDYEQNFVTSSQILNIIVTVNPPSNNDQLSLTVRNGNLTLASNFSTSNLAVYQLPSSWDGFGYKGAANTICSFYTWVSSDETALWANHDDSHTDVGDVITNAEAGYYFALTPVGINFTIHGFEYTALDASDAGIIAAPFVVNTKPGCTLMYELEKIPHCNPGPFTHQLNIFTNRGALTRVFPGICVNTFIQNEPPTSAPVELTTASGTYPQTCTVEGTAVFADDRNHPFRDFIFAVEWSDSDYHFINDVDNIIPSLLDSIYNVYFQQRFTFIIFNKNYVSTLVSQTRRDYFESRVHTIIQAEIGQIFSGWWNNTETASDSIDSVIMANLETLNPKAQVFVFTANPGTGAQPNLKKILPKSIQVNYFYSSQIFDAYPFSVMTRQTNGRWFSAAYPEFFIESYLATTSELVYDVVYQNDEGAPVTHAFRVDAEATTLEILINGAIQNFSLTGASNASLEDKGVLSGTMGMSVVDISKRGADLYTLQVFCTFCTIQIRLASPVQVILGFTGYPNDDTRIQTEPSAWLRMDTTQSYNSYVAARVTGLPSNETVTSFTVSAHMGSLHGTSFTANTQSNVNQMVANMQLRNSSYCSYQWIGEIDSEYEFLNWTPELDGIQFIVSIKTDKGNEYTRIVYYYQPNELLDTFICQNGGTLDGYGDCKCTTNYTGDYCEVPVCLHGGRQNFGACNCQPQYIGQFCENKITVPYYRVLTTTTKQPTTTSQTVTRPTRLTSAAQNKTATASSTPMSASTSAVTKPPVTSSSVPITTPLIAITSTEPKVPQSTVTVPKIPTPIASSTVQTPNTTVSISSSRIPLATTPKNGSSSLSIYFVILLFTILSVFKA